MMGRGRNLRKALWVAGLVWLTGVGCAKPPSITKEDGGSNVGPESPAKTSPEPAAPTTRTLWCRGGGEASATVSLSLSDGPSYHDVHIVVDFQFARAQLPAGAGGADLPPGSCAYADARYEQSPVRLRGSDNHAELHWHTTAKGNSSVAPSSHADGLKSDRWLMQAEIDPAKPEIVSWQTWGGRFGTSAK